MQTLFGENWCNILSNDKMNKKGNLIIVALLGIVLVLFIGWFITNNIYVTYKTIQLNDDDYICKNNNIELKPNALTEYGFEVRGNAQESCVLHCRLGAYNYYKEKEVVFCNENNEASCDCKVSVYSYYIYDFFKRN